MAVMHLRFPSQETPDGCHALERYVPKFYKWTAAIFWTGMALLLLYLLLRYRL